ncbi:transcription initiation factor TFIID subunit 7-like isoform X1 [Prionailurus viverrinus]|uniref:transcription initiation factor TFIID subunit 7-like isoform X1 n=2 Tax=Prionailurus viverrinus TaxID=61388 RepID=UPI001FF2F134|nr:transcription initiation factor TFIID subunit 7-like isoform X1 [Prionailurus viverrinus]
MEYSEQEPPNSLESDSTPTASTSEVTGSQDPQIPEDSGAEYFGDLGAETATNEGTQTSADGTQADVDGGTDIAAKTPEENLLEGTEMSKSQDEPPQELENQFILRLPLEHAFTVRKMVHSGSVAMKDKLKIDLSSDGRHAVVDVENVSLTAKLVDLPCIIGSLKTLDKKTFYKTADISQMLVCTADDDLHSSPEESVTSTDLNAVMKNEKEREQKYVWKHGITPPLKNVRKKRFRKTTKKLTDFKQIEEISFPEEQGIPAKHRVLNDITDIPPSPDLVQYIESPDVEKEVKRLLCSDAEALSARWEVIAEDETKEIESQGSIPGFAMSPGISGYKQGHFSSEYGMFREMFSDSSSNSDDEDEEEDEDDEEDEEDDEEDDYDEDEVEKDYYEEDLERELQAKFFASGQYEAKEGASSAVMDIQKQIHYMEKKLQEIQCKAQRQRDLLKKVENLTLKSHLQSVLEQLKLQEKEKNEQLIFLREQLKSILEK